MTYKEILSQLKYYERKRVLFETYKNKKKEDELKVKQLRKLDETEEGRLHEFHRENKEDKKIFSLLFL